MKDATPAQLGYRWPAEWELQASVWLSWPRNPATWPEHFARAGYHTARVSKVFHMGVPGDIEAGAAGADDSRSWNERHDVQGPEWRAPGGVGECPPQEGNTFLRRDRL